MQESPKPTSRKKFLLWSATILSSAAVFKFIRIPKKKKSETVKMLTQDGKLVEIDKKLLASPGKKISDIELQQWVKK
ncbi:MAG TPA: hypothetical protein VIL78_16470 [Hanamia sp.]